MYNLNDLVALELKIRFIHVKYVPILRYFQDYYDSNNITVAEVSKNLKSIQVETGHIETLLLRLKDTKTDEIIDYSRVAKHLKVFCYDQPKAECWNNFSIWENIIQIIKTDGFPIVFAYFLRKHMRIKETNTLILTKYKNISNSEIFKLNVDLVDFNNNLVDFINNVEAVCLMIQYLEQKEIFSQTAINPDAGRVMGKKKPLLLIVAKNE